uniref:Glutamine-rich protein n=2 Tax=Haliotis asinina TaxID=109174 RepID=QRP_HALAI|nr:RecName: Full=Glutamine-rich protein [Haliotis asinina]
MAAYCQAQGLDVVLAALLGAINQQPSRQQFQQQQQQQRQPQLQQQQQQQGIQQQPQGLQHQQQQFGLTQQHGQGRRQNIVQPNPASQNNNRMMLDMLLLNQIAQSNRMNTLAFIMAN